jgi:hypothetical protein
MLRRFEVEGYRSVTAEVEFEACPTVIGPNQGGKHDASRAVGELLPGVAVVGLDVVVVRCTARPPGTDPFRACAKAISVLKNSPLRGTAAVARFDPSDGTLIAPTVRRAATRRSRRGGGPRPRRCFDV